MVKKLKVFRTAVGFHDAYVAAPSRKAALEAWGSDANLFSTGAAEEISDPVLAKAPLAKPGEVVKLPRGTTAEHIAALPKASPHAQPKRAKRQQKEAPVAKHIPRPRPSRNKLDAAREALAQCESRYDRAMAEIEENRRTLDAEQERLTQDQNADIERLQQVVDRESAAYKRAIDRWQRSEEHTLNSSH